MFRMDLQRLTHLMHMSDVVEKIALVIIEFYYNFSKIQANSRKFFRFENVLSDLTI